MSIFAVKEQMDALVAELNQHTYNYYVLAMPTIADYEFDKKLEALAALEKAHPEFADPNSPTQKVGGDITKNFITVKHKWPMLSLGNTYNEQDLRDFDERVKKAIGNDFEYVCELKFDGLSISLTYENGVLVRAVTRGDGTQGDDVTSNIKTIHTIPHRLKGDDVPEVFEIRGEVFMHRAAFERLNKEREELGEIPYANPRNFASGTVKMQDPKEVKKRPLDCLLYFVIGNNLPFKTQFEGLQKARDWGFKVPTQSKLANSIRKKYSFLENYSQNEIQDLLNEINYTKIISNKQSLVFENKCIEKYNNCNRISNIVYTAEVLGCTATAIGIGAITGGVGGVFFQLACGGVAIEHLQAMRVGCKLDFEDCN